LCNVLCCFKSKTKSDAVTFGINGDKIVIFGFVMFVILYH
jgi:hypothetical protein